MATATLTLAGSLTLQAPSYPPSAAQQVAQPISETLYVADWDPPGSALLSTDAATPIPFPLGMTSCNFLFLKVQGGSPVTLQITSADGSLQAIPVDDLIVLKTLAVPMTAISVTRTAGIATTLTYLIAQKA